MSAHVIVVDEKADLEWASSAGTALTARDFVTHPERLQGKKLRVVNLSGEYAYLDFGYYTSLLAARLFDSAGLRPADVDVALLYDCFSSVVLFALEGLGFADRGGAGALVRSGATRPGGQLPVNPHGGLLNEGYLHGMNTLAEAVIQLQGRAGERQVADARVAAVTSGALQDGSALVLTRH